MKSSHTLKCPACHRPLLNRLSGQCLYCCKELPDHLKLTDQEKKEILEQQSAQLEHDRLLREQKEAEEKEKQERLRKNSDGDWGIFPFFFF